MLENTAHAKLQQRKMTGSGFCIGTGQGYIILRVHSNEEAHTDSNRKQQRTRCNQFIHA